MGTVLGVNFTRSRRYFTTVRLEQALKKIDEESGTSLINLIHRSVGEVVGPGSLGPDSRTSGSHVGLVFVELADTSERSLKSDEILSQWRTKTRCAAASPPWAG